MRLATGKIVTFLLVSLCVRLSYGCQETPSVVVELRKEVRESYYTITSNLKCIASHLGRKSDGEAKDNLQELFNSYVQFLDAIDKGESVSKLKNLSYKNVELFGKLSVHLPQSHEDPAFVMGCMSLGFELQGYSMKLGNEPN